MIYFLEFKAEHLELVRLQKDQEWSKGYLVKESLVNLEGPHAITVFRDSTPIACAGAISFGDGRACLWSFMGADITAKDFRCAHGIIKRIMDALPFRRLEMYVDCQFENGHRWARVLGFEMECERMKSFQENGTDSALYAKVK